MNIIIQNKIHVIRECVNYALTSVNNIDLKTSYEETYSEYYPLLQMYNTTFRQEVRLTKKEQEYFQYFSSYQCCLAQLLLYTFAPLHEIDTFECYETLMLYFNKYDLADFPCFFPYSSGLSLEKNKQPFMKSVQALDLTDAEQLKVIYAFYNYEESIVELLNVLKRIYNETIVKINKDDMSKFMNYFNVEVKDNRIEKYINIFFDDNGVDDLHDDSPIIFVYPMLSLFDSFSMYRDNYGRNYLLFGLGRSIEYFKYQNNDKNNSEIVNFLNILGDTTKLSILRNIKRNARYGNELAKLLNLQTSTISYHMDTLCKLHLVKVNKVGKRLYYSLNNAEIDRLFNMIREIL